MSGMASFLVGLGGGYIKAKDKQYEQDRQAKIDARADWEHNQRVEAASRDSKLRTDMTDASRALTMEQGAGGMVKPTEMDNRDVGLPENAAQPNGGLMMGGYKVGGESFTDKSKATEVLVKMNSPEAVVERQAQAYRNNGKPLEANQMQASLMDLKLKKLGLNEAEAKWGDAEFDRILKQKVPMGPGFGHAFAKVLSETKVGGLDGVNFEAVYAPDGKTFEIVGTGADGTRLSRGQFTDDDAGWAQAMQRANSADLTTKIGYVAEAGKAAREAEKIAIQERLAAAREKQVDAMAAKLAGGGGGGGRSGGGSGGGGDDGGQGGGGAAGLPDAMTGFDSKKAYAAAVERAMEELSQGGTPATEQAIAKRATSIYRSLESEFKTTGLTSLGNQAFAQSAAKAKTPQDVANVFQQGLAFGLTPSQMAAIDPRFKQQPPPPAPAPPSPPSQPPRPMSEFQRRLQAAKAEETARREADKKASDELRERQRQEALKQRPDLQQMGGMRYFN